MKRERERERERTVQLKLHLMAVETSQLDLPIIQYLGLNPLSLGFCFGILECFYKMLTGIPFWEPRSHVSVDYGFWRCESSYLLQLEHDTGGSGHGFTPGLFPSHFQTLWTFMSMHVFTNFRLSERHTCLARRISECQFHAKDQSNISSHRQLG